MKKTVLSFIIASLLGLNNLHAQCTPDTSFKQPGLYPDSATGLPHGKVGQSYSTVIQVRVFTDTVVFGVHATVDSIVLNSVTGLPYHFTYSCNPSSCSFPGGSNGCATLYSTTDPADSLIGSHPLSINITAYGNVPGFGYQHLPYTVNKYSLRIDSANVGVIEQSSTRFDLRQNFPDPATGLTDIYYSVPAGTMLYFKLYNLLGKVVYQKSFYADRKNGRITLDAKDYSQGIYMYSLSNGKTTLTRRMVMNSN